MHQTAVTNQNFVTLERGCCSRSHHVDRVARPGAIIPPVFELTAGDMAAEQPPLAAETLAGLLQE